MNFILPYIDVWYIYLNSQIYLSQQRKSGILRGVVIFIIYLTSVMQKIVPKMLQLKKVHEHYQTFKRNKLKKQIKSERNLS